jgi:hypothetical protein
MTVACIQDESLPKVTAFWWAAVVAGVLELLFPVCDLLEERILTNIGIRPSSIQARFFKL